MEILDPVHNMHGVLIASCRLRQSLPQKEAQRGDLKAPICSPCNEEFRDVDGGIFCMQATQVEFLGKMAGAVGNYNAHLSAHPTVDWQAVAQQFVASLDLDWNPYVTQVTQSDAPQNPVSRSAQEY